MCELLALPQLWEEAWLSCIIMVKNFGLEKVAVLYRGLVGHDAQKIHSRIPKDLNRRNSTYILLQSNVVYCKRGVGKMDVIVAV